MNASTLLDFFSQLNGNKTPNSKSAAAAAAAAVAAGGNTNMVAFPVSSGGFLVKEEPLSEDDSKALQKDRQKKDNHNMSKNENDIPIAVMGLQFQILSTANTD